MTKQVSFLADQNFCAKCEKVKRQAEDAFRELRIQADLHIAAIEAEYSKKLQGEKANFAADLERLKAEYSVVTTSNHQLSVSVDRMGLDYEGKLGQLEHALEVAESRAKSEMDQLVRKSKKEIRTLQVRIEELEAQLAEKERALIEAKTSKSNDWSIEKAKLDLAYRKRIGEMESEVRRTEIESVRLRKQIFSLEQRLNEPHDLSQHFGSVKDRFMDEKSGRIARVKPN